MNILVQTMTAMRVRCSHVTRPKTLEHAEEHAEGQLDPERRKILHLTALVTFTNRTCLMMKNLEFD